MRSTRPARRCPTNVLKHAQDSDAILLGAVGGPKWDNPNADKRPEQALLGLRKALGLFANVRPVKTVKELIAASPLKPEMISGVDLVVIRELTGGIYYGKPSEKRDGEGRARGGRYLLLHRGRNRARAALRLRARARAPQEADLGRQGQRARDVALVARDRNRAERANSRTSRSRISWSIRWRCI